MNTATMPPCANCQRLQAEVDDLRSTRRPPGRRRAVAEATRRGPEGLLQLVQAAFLRHRQAPQAAAAGQPAARKRGGQPGHTSHQREFFPPEMLASLPTDYLLDACPGCGGHLHLTDAEPIRVVQRVDILDVPTEVHEHRSHPTWCPHCRKTHYAPLPLSIERGGLAGPRLTTVIAYLKGVCHASFSTIRKFIRDVIGLTISRGQLAQIIGKVSRGSSGPMRDSWTSCRTRTSSMSMRPGTSGTADGSGPGASGPQLYTLFKIDPSRGSQMS